MNKPAVVSVLGAAVLATVVFWFTQRDGAEVASESAAASPQPTTQSASSPTPALGGDSLTQSTIASPSDVAAMMDAADVDEYSEDPAKMFKADAAGNLIVKERTRINIEKLSWLYTPEELQQKLGVIERTLPPSAYRQLVDLMDRFKNYSLAAKQAYSPETAPATVEEAIAQHEGLQALRRAHFGDETAEGMFGREERLSGKLLEFMSLEQHKGLTLEEKAMKAQEMLSKSPELAQLYEDNRTGAAEE